MPWNMEDYPASMKNLDPLVRKKAIAIANALLADGYPDEKKAFQKAKTPKKNDPHEHDKNAKKLMNAAVNVRYEEDHWVVRSDNAKQASDTFDKKDAAVKRGKEIAENKRSSVAVYKKDGTLQKTYDFSE